MMATAVNFTALCDRYLRTQLGGDRRAAIQFIDDTLRSGVSAMDVRFYVVQAAQREIGRLWQEDRISIAQEHMATAISQVALAHLFQHTQFRARVGRKILVACVPGELHDFPARLLADTLDGEGYDVRYLGADVPLESLLTSITTEQPDLLALSVTMLFNLKSLRDTVKAVRARAHHPPPIAIGGNAVISVGRELGMELGVELAATDYQTFVPQLDRFFGART